LKLVCRNFIRLIEQAGLLPRSVAKAVKQKRRQLVLDGREVERLDRIRNPSKYRGK
jgi:hypothetical protein